MDFERDRNKLSIAAGDCAADPLSKSSFLLLCCFYRTKKVCSFHKVFAYCEIRIQGFHILVSLPSFNAETKREYETVNIYVTTFVNWSRRLR